MRHLRRTVVAVAVLLSLTASGGAAGEVVREFDLPALSFATGLAVGRDGSVWISSTYADKLIRFEPATGTTRQIDLPQRTHPGELLVDPRGAVWYAGGGLGLVGRVEPDGRTIREFAIPTIQTARFAIPSPWALALDGVNGQVWFTVQSDGLLAWVPVGAQPIRRAFVVSELKLGPSDLRPDGISLDRHGVAWVAELGADRLAAVDPRSGVARLALPMGSRPRGLAAAPDGTIWATLFGSGRLLRLDPASRQIRSWPMPATPRSNPYAVVVDSAGGVWVSDVTANTIARFDPSSERFTSFPLPTPRSGVRALAVDGQRRVWFVGSYSGRLGVIEPAGPATR